MKSESHWEKASHSLPATSLMSKNEKDHFWWAAHHCWGRMKWQVLLSQEASTVGDNAGNNLQERQPEHLQSDSSSFLNPETYFYFFLYPLVPAQGLQRPKAVFSGWIITEKVFNLSAYFWTVGGNLNTHTGRNPLLIIITGIFQHVQIDSCKIGSYRWEARSFLCS